MSTASTVLEQLSLLPKMRLVEALREAGLPVGDYARRGKDEYVRAVAALGEDIARDVIARSSPMAASLISGAVPGLRAPASSPVRDHHEPLPRIERVGEKSLGELFGVRGKYSQAKVGVWSDPAAPTPDPMYRFSVQVLHAAAMMVEAGINPWLAGPAGTGKTAFVREFCARTGRAFIRASLDSGIERYELIGGERVRNGSVVYQDGLVLRGIRRPGAVILLDEISTARPEHLTALHAVLEGDGAVTIPETGEVVRRAPGVVFFAADNSAGRGDASGLYVNVRDQSIALLDRFAVLEFGYLDEDTEVSVISERCGIPRDGAGMIVGFLKVCRTAADAATVDAPPSIRQAFILANLIKRGVAPRFAFEAAIANRAPADVREQLQQLWKANVNDAEIEAAVCGKEPPQSAQREDA